MSLLALIVFVGGCDSRSDQHSQADQAAAENFSEFGEKSTERIAEQIESEGAYFPDSTDDIDEYVEMVEDASKNVSQELAAQLKSQASIMKELQVLMNPYLEMNNTFYDLGGVDAATLSTPEDIENRVGMIKRLIEINDQIDVRFPILFNQIAGSDTPEGKQQLAVAKQMRALDREAYPHMIESLLIVKEYWATSGNANDGKFYFGDDVPADAIEAYNNHLAAIEAVGLKQMEIQRQHYNVP
ncbi:MAG: hypothetical protein P1U30_04620 [Phycisphaerales bacterium]|nr:hypothetical protein [Phycisphaerales bacterium]